MLGSRAVLQCFNCGKQNPYRGRAKPGVRGRRCPGCSSALTTVLAGAEAERYQRSMAITAEGEGWFRSERYEFAISSFRQALELTPDDPVLLMDLGNALGMLGWDRRDRGLLEESAACFARALTLFPDYERCRDNRNMTLSKLAALEQGGPPSGSAATPEQLREALSEGTSHLRSGRLPEAIERLSWVLTHSVANADAHLALGIAYAMQHDYDKAKTHLTTALDIAPTAAAAYNLGLVHDQLGAPASALESMKQAVSLNADHVQARAWLERHGHRPAPSAPAAAAPADPPAAAPAPYTGPAIELQGFSGPEDSEEVVRALVRAMMPEPGESGYRSPLEKPVRARVRALGDRLYAIGTRLDSRAGHEIMQAAHMEVQAQLGRLCARELEAAWGGVGEWQA